MSVHQDALGDLITATSRSEQVLPEGEYPMMGVRSFGGGAFDAGQLRGSDTSYPTLRKVKTGDVVYPKLMAWEGAFAIVPAELNDRFVSPEFCVFEADRLSVSRAFLRHLLSWDGFREQLGGHSVGTNARRRRLHPDVFLDHQIPLPELDEQRRIAAHLDSLDGLADMVAQRNEIAQALLVSARNEIFIARQRHSPPAVLRDILTLERRAVVVEQGKSYREIGVRSFGRGLFEKEPTSAADLGSKRVFNVHPGDLVVSNIFAWEGAVAVADVRHEGTIGSHRFITWVPRASGVDVEYLRHYFASDLGLDGLRSASPGSAGRNRTLSIKNFENSVIPLPDLDEQRRIATHLDALDGLVDLMAKRAKVAQALPVSARTEIFSAMV
jgi:type I restriction enzyme S subunit